jgi:hypothetical protein
VVDPMADHRRLSRHRHRVEMPHLPVGAALDNGKGGTAALLRPVGTMEEKRVGVTIHSRPASILAERRAGVRSLFHPALILATKKVGIPPLPPRRRRLS